MMPMDESITPEEAHEAYARAQTPGDRGWGTIHAAGIYGPDEGKRRRVAFWAWLAGIGQRLYEWADGNARKHANRLITFGTYERGNQGDEDLWSGPYPPGTHFTPLEFDNGDFELTLSTEPHADRDE